MKYVKAMRKSFAAFIVTLLFVFTVVQGKPVSASTNEVTYVGNGYEVTIAVENSWPGAFNGNVTVKNTTDEVFHNWAIEFDMGHEITNIWNGMISKHTGDTYVVRNAIWNQDIDAHGAVSFGFTAKADSDIVLATEFKLLGTEVLVKTSDYTVEFDVVSDWQSAYNAEIRITNTSSRVIEDWKLQFDFDYEIERFWKCSILENDGGRYLIQNNGYNANIQPGQTIILGFTGNPGNVTTVPTNYVFTEIIHEYVELPSVPIEPEFPEKPEDVEDVEVPVIPTTGPDFWCPGIQDPEYY